MKLEEMIRVVTGYNDALDVLNYYSNCLASLQTGSVEPSVMANKFISYGTVIEIIDSQQRIGFAAFYHNDKKQKRAFLSMIAVFSQYQGKGYAAKLINEAERMSIADDMKTMALEVNRNNSRAISFYQKCGYSISAFANETCYLMEKQL